MATAEELRTPTYRLELTASEAESLVMILRSIGGTPGGRRGHTDAILTALIAAGVLTLPVKVVAKNGDELHFID